jgi:hypothetical protein
MGRKNSQSPRRDRKAEEVWSDEDMRNAKPYPLPEVPGTEPPKRKPAPAPRQSKAGKPGLVEGVPPEGD